MPLREINLVPADVLELHHLKCQAVRWGLVLAGCLTIMFGTYLYQSRIVLARLRPSTTLADMHAQLGATLDDISNTQQEIERLSMQQSILKELSVHQSFPDLLELLAETLNPQTWLTEMVIEAGGPQATMPGMRLKGYAVSNELLADFLTRLSKAPPVDSVVLKFAREASVAGLVPDDNQLIPVVSFDIACRLKEFKP